VAVREGDEIIAVDGRPVDPVHGPGPALAGTHGKPVELTIKPADPSLVPRPPADEEDDEDDEDEKSTDSTDTKDADSTDTKDAKDTAKSKAAPKAEASPEA